MIATKDDFKKFIDDIESRDGYRAPIGFGIARVDRGQKSADKILQANFPVVNWNENFGSGAVFIKALEDAGFTIDFGKSEFVATVDEKFIQSSMDSFSPFLDELSDGKHKNIQVVKTLSQIDDLGKNFRIVLLFEDAKPQSVEAVYLKLYALSLQKAPLRSLNLDGAFGILTNVA